jgi:hypothetical protein
VVILACVFDGELLPAYQFSCWTVINVFSALLLVTLRSYRRIFRRVNMVNIMTTSLLVRLTVFCLYRLVFARYVLFGYLKG